MIAQRKNGARKLAKRSLGFGAQSLVRDCISGLFMLIEDQYGIGDQVDLGPASGTVERISLRTTVLRGADGTVWHVCAGTVLVIPDGWVGTWVIEETVIKSYAVFRDGTS